MVNLCLDADGVKLLKSILGKTLIKYRHDPLDKFGDETVFGRIELFLQDEIIMISYDYYPYPLFNNDDDDHPKFNATRIKENEAVSALENTKQIDIKSGKTINDIVLVEENVHVEWDGKIDDVSYTKAIILEFSDEEIAFQGDYMMPLIEIIKGERVKDKLIREADEFADDEDTKYTSQRKYIELSKSI